MEFLIGVTQTRIVKAHGNTKLDAIKDIQDNPELYGQMPPDFGEEIKEGSYRDDFKVNEPE